MARMVLRLALNEARDEAAIELHQEGVGPLGHITYDAASVEGLIRSLARLRAEMAEPVAPELDPGARVEVMENPARHPGLGWLAFLFSRDRAVEIGQALDRYSSAE
jgi:hypothetical protein